MNNEQTESALAPPKVGAGVSGDRLTDKYINIPITEGVVLRRVGGQVVTNVTHNIVYHSPDGFEFGFAGSGPADLALNILEQVLRVMGFESYDFFAGGPKWGGRCFAFAFNWHQPFKWEFLVDLDESGANIPYQDIESWLIERITD